MQTVSSTIKITDDHLKKAVLFSRELLLPVADPTRGFRGTTRFCPRSCSVHSLHHTTITSNWKTLSKWWNACRRHSTMQVSSTYRLQKFSSFPSKMCCRRQRLDAWEQTEAEWWKNRGHPFFSSLTWPCSLTFILHLSWRLQHSVHTESKGSWFLAWLWTNHETTCH